MFPKTHSLKRLAQTRNKFYVDINDIAWPSGAAGIWTNQLTSDGKLKDLSGNENHGTINGATMIPGPWGDCLYFDGVDDKVDLGLLTQLNAFEIFVVVNQSGSSDHDINTVFRQATLPDDFSWVDLWYDMSVHNFYSHCKTPSGLVSTGKSSSTDKYYLINTSRSDGLFRIHVNDVLCQELTSVGDVVVPTEHFNLGTYWQSGLLYFMGSIAAFAIYPRVLTPTERTSVYTQLFGEWS